MATVVTFLVVIVGWVFSLCLHEFSHALVAYYGGDTSVREKGYLTFNPLKYTHPVYSILMPMIFLLLGGIGLPGGRSTSRPGACGANAGRAPFHWPGRQPTWCWRWYFRSFAILHRPPPAESGRGWHSWGCCKSWRWF